MTPRELEERTFRYGVRILQLGMHLYGKGLSYRLIDQLMSAGTSVGANVEESHACDSRPDFIHKRGISLRECRESVYWMRLFLAAGAVTAKNVADLVVEGNEIAKILAKGILTTKRGIGRK